MESGDEQVFSAALNGDLQTLQRFLPTHKDQTCQGGHTPLHLASSAGHTQCASALLRADASVDPTDDTGTTPLMHAAMHGYAALVDLLLLHGADPLLQRHDGEHALSLAALYGRPASLGTFFRADPTLVEATNRNGRTPLHNAVVLGHLITIKYLIGRWKANVHLTDAEGQTTLHLARGVPHVLMYLLHGTSTMPSLLAVNKKGRTPLDEIELEDPDSKLLPSLREATEYLKNAASHDGQAQKESCVKSCCDEHKKKPWLLDSKTVQRNLLSFMLDSSAREPPLQTPRPPWWMSLDTTSASLFLIMNASYFSLLLWPLAVVYLAVFVVVSWGALAICAWRGIGGARRVWQVIANSIQERRRLVFRKKVASPIYAFGLAWMIAAVIVGHSVFVAPRLVKFSPLLLYSTVFWTVLTVGFYVYTVTIAPAFIPGGCPDDNTEYWLALEKLPHDADFPDEFCDRSELLKIPRARFSPFAGGMLRAFDHDCLWIGQAVDASNHAAFFSFIFSALVGMSLHFAGYCAAFPHWRSLLSVAISCPASQLAGYGCLRARLIISSFVADMALLFGMVAPLFIFQLWGVSANLTTVEMLRFRFKYPGRSTPWCFMRGSYWNNAWEEYAPYDKGILNNFDEFFAGRGAA